MDVKEYLKKVSYIKEWNDGLGHNHMCYYSNFDNSYITMAGFEDNVKFLAEHEVTEDLTHGVGFSPKDNKWYGWSHRAIYGFTINSTCKKGDCHYEPSTKEDWIEDYVNFYHDNEYHETTWFEIEKDNDEGIFIISRYNDKVPNEKLRGTEFRRFVEFPEQYGKGEWIAKTMEDAKQMAIDFSSSVS